MQEDDLSNLEDLFQNFDSQSSKDGVDFESKYKKWYTSPGYVGDRIDIGSEWEDGKVGSGSVGGGSGYQFSVPKRGFHLPPMEEDSGSGSSVQKILTGKGIKAQDTASRVEMWMQQRNINKDKKNDILESHKVHQGNLVCAHHRMSVLTFVCIKLFDLLRIDYVFNCTVGRAVHRNVPTEK